MSSYMQNSCLTLTALIYPSAWTHCGGDFQHKQL